MLRLLAIATPAAGNTKFTAAIGTLTELLARVRNRSANVTEADLTLLKETAKFQGLCKVSDWPAAADFEKYKSACTKTRDAVAKGAPQAIEEDTAREAALFGQKLLRLAGDVVAAYQRRKQDIAKLDFSDQLALAHALVSDPQRSELRGALSKDLRLLLVDEFQDTDPLQVDLIKKICGCGFDEGRLFFVGDFKQSIYRFRGAVPPEFLKLRGDVPEAGRLQLTENFRSQPGVLHFVNALFRDAFENYEELKPRREATSAAPAV
jgi:ATP-dependent helicase/nuclease subunit A